MIIARLSADESGATAIEYGLIAALIAIGLIAAFILLGGSVTNLFDSVAQAAGAVMGGGGS